MDAVLDFANCKMIGVSVEVATVCIQPNAEVEVAVSEVTTFKLVNEVYFDGSTPASFGVVVRYEYPMIARITNATHPAFDLIISIILDCDYVSN